MSDQSGYVPPAQPAPPTPPPPGSAAPPPGMPPGQAPASMSGRPAPVDDTSKIFAALSYPIGIVAIIALLLEPYKDQKFVRFHAVQGLGWLVVEILIGVLSGVLGAVSSFVPYVWIITGAIPGLLYLVWFIVAIVWAVKAWNGEYAELPGVYGVVKSYVGE